MRGWWLMVALIPGIAVAQTAPVGVAEPGGAQTDTRTSAQGDVAITIYSNDVALVQDVRRLTLAPGTHRQDFPDVSDHIRPNTVRLAAAGTTIVEQNYDYDLLSPEALMEKAVGQTVTLVRTNPATGAETRESARVLAVNDGTVVQIGNRIEVLREDGLPVRVVYDRLPPNLRARPTLSVTLDTQAGGPRPVTLSYLAGGFGWSADYVALFDEAKSTVEVQGWVTLRNNGNTSFPNARVLLVAGAPGQSRGRGLAPGTVPGTETAGRARLGDYYLYPIAGRTTVAASQQKQVSFLDVSSVPARKAYQFRNGWLQTSNEAQSASSVLSFSASRSGGLGDALPAGTVRFYMRDAGGQPQFVGESRIDHTPMGSQLALATGEAFDVKVKPVVEARTRRSDTRWRTVMRYTLTNARPQPVTVELVQAGLDGGSDTRIEEQSQPGTRRSADEAVWQVTVPANGEASLSATFDTRF